MEKGYYMTISVVVLLVATVFLPAKITGYASADDPNSLIQSAVSAIDLNQIKQDFKANEDLIREITQVEKQNSLEPGILVGLIYHESSSFNINAIRCEKSYEIGNNGPWERLVTDLDCDKFNCDYKLSQLKCEYPGCNEQVLDSYKSRYADYHQVSCSYGIGQLMYPTAAQMGFEGSAGKLLEPSLNLFYAAKYFHSQIKYYGSTILALAAYNAGSKNVNHCKDFAAKNDYAGFINCMPKSRITAQYITLIPIYSVIFDDLINGRDVDMDKIADEIKKRYNFEMPAVSQIKASTMDVHPNFEIKLQYDFSDYDLLKSGAKKMVETCTDPFDVDSCVSKQIAELNKRDNGRVYWQYGNSCIASSSSNPKEFTDFMEYFERCINSVSNDCYCPGMPSFGKVIQFFRIQQSYSNVFVSGMVGTEERYTSKPYENLNIADTEILGASGRFIDIDNIHSIDKNYLGKNSKGELISIKNPEKACLMDMHKIIPFCVKSQQKIDLIEKGKLNEKEISYHFALSFGKEESTPPSGATILRSRYTTFKSGNIISKVGEIR